MEKGRNLAAICAGNKGRAAYFQNVSETKPDPEVEEETIPQIKGEITQGKSDPKVGDQIKAVLVLIPVLGILWLTIQYLPKGWRLDW